MLTALHFHMRTVAVTTSALADPKHATIGLNRVPKC